MVQAIGWYRHRVPFMYGSPAEVSCDGVCRQHVLTSLNVSKCAALTTLNCNHNKLTSLDVSNCTALGILHCYSNQLISLDLSNCPALRELYCYSNQFTSLDVSNCLKLNTLYFDGDELWMKNGQSIGTLRNFKGTKKYKD